MQPYRADGFCYQIEGATVNRTPPAQDYRQEVVAVQAEEDRQEDHHEHALTRTRQEGSPPKRTTSPMSSRCTCQREREAAHLGLGELLSSDGATGTDDSVVFKSHLLQRSPFLAHVEDELDLQLCSVTPRWSRQARIRGTAKSKTH